MNTRPAAASKVFALTVCLCVSCAFASPLPQTKKRSKSDADINAIGHRHIDRDENLYSLDKEKRLGLGLSEAVDRSSRLLNDPAVTEYIDKVAQVVAKNSDARLPIVVRVIDSDVANSFTLPGGYQYVNRGLLLRLEGEAELASVMARGVAHTSLRSGTTAATRGEAMQLAMIPLMFSMPWPGDSSFIATPFAIPSSLLKLRQDDELDADYFGVQYLYKAGYDPKCFTRFVQRIWASGTASTKKSPKVLSFYPPVDIRLAALQNEISEILPPRDGASVSTSEFDALLERLRAQKSEELKPPTLRTLSHAVPNLP
jgi:predicted Zn-dependent protease